MRIKKFKVAITDAEYASHSLEYKVLSQLNVTLLKFKCKTEDDVIKNCRDADALLVQYAPITRRVLESLENVKIIVRYGVGVDNIDLAAATEKRIFVSNVVYDITDVAEHTVALILAFTRKLPQSFRIVKEGKWDWKLIQPTFRLMGRILGLIGFGRVAREVARRMKTFGVTLLAYDPYLPFSIFKEYNVKKVDLDNIIENADIITLHVPLTNETRHIIGEAQLRRMKKTAILINTSRGALLDEKALYNALKEKWIAGAALDVLETEPPTADNPLLNLDNVIVTPHMAWYSPTSLREIQIKAAEEVARVLSGKSPLSLVNKDVLKLI